MEMLLSLSARGRLVAEMLVRAEEVEAEAAAGWPVASTSILKSLPERAGGNKISKSSSGSPARGAGLASVGAKE